MPLSLQARARSLQASSASTAATPGEGELTRLGSKEKEDSSSGLGSGSGRRGKHTGEVAEAGRKRRARRVWGAGAVSSWAAQLDEGEAKDGGSGGGQARRRVFFPSYCFTPNSGGKLFERKQTLFFLSLNLSLQLNERKYLFPPSFPPTKHNIREVILRVNI